MSQIDPVDEGGPVAPPERRGPERRTTSRRRVYLQGKIVYPHHGISADCTIRDLSDGGARISASPEAVCADMFLIVVKEAVVHRSVTAWRSDGLAGLQFLDTTDLSQETPPHLRRIQNLWLELAPR